MEEGAIKIENKIKQYLEKLNVEYETVPPRDIGLRSWESENSIKRDEIATKIQAIEELIVYLQIDEE